MYVDAGWSPTLARQCEIQAEWGQMFFSAVTLACLRAHGQTAAERVETAGMIEHQRKYFLPGLATLNLLGEPTDAMRCAKYHYLTNTLGGVSMDYVEESPTKVWLRYLPPSPVYADSIAAYAPDFGHLPWGGWHGRNAIMLDNPRLSYVLTQSWADGEPWTAGYFVEYDHDIEPARHFQYRPGEPFPHHLSSPKPTITSEYADEDRALRAKRAYFIGWCNTRIWSLMNVLGVADAANVVAHAVRTTFTHRSPWVFETFGMDKVREPVQAATLFARMLSVLGDDIEVVDNGSTALLRQRTCRFWRDVDFCTFEIDQALTRGWEPLLQLCEPRLRVSGLRAMSAGDESYEWEFRLVR